MNRSRRATFQRAGAARTSLVRLHVPEPQPQPQTARGRARAPRRRGRGRSGARRRGGGGGGARTRARFLLREVHLGHERVDSAGDSPNSQCAAIARGAAEVGLRVLVAKKSTPARAARVAQAAAGAPSQTRGGRATCLEEGKGAGEGGALRVIRELRDAREVVRVLKGEAGRPKRAERDFASPATRARARGTSLEAAVLDELRPNAARRGKTRGGDGGGRGAERGESETGGRTEAARERRERARARARGRARARLSPGA